MGNLDEFAFSNSGFRLDLYVLTPVSLTSPNGLIDFSMEFAPSNKFRDASGFLTPTPLPAALPLFAGGLGALGLLGWRRKRKAAAAA